MIELSFSDADFVLRWLADHPMAGTLMIVVIQILILTLVAECAARRLLKGQAIQSHRLWLMAVTLVLLLLPFHFSFGGWQVRVAQSQDGVVAAEKRDSDISQTVASSPQADRTAALTATKGVIGSPEQGDRSRDDLALADRAATASVVSNTTVETGQSLSNARAERGPGSLADSVNAARPADSIARGWSAGVASALACLYLLGLAV